MNTLKNPDLSKFKGVILENNSEDGRGELGEPNAS